MPRQNYWNLVESAKAVGAKATAPPLGLLTVAALLPANWKFTLVDLNVREITTKEWEEADIICTGGMLPQQEGILDIINRAKKDGKYVAVGGPDPSSQPDLYGNADALVLGEGESSIPNWLESWASGKPNGVFLATKTPDMSQTPVPRFDLISFSDYLYVGLQTSRGCPYNCEFCDVIELFGRVPRVKPPARFVKELEALYQLGYRGLIDIADDNFIGNRLKIKPVLAEVAQWLEKNSYPFVFSTEASVNLADDDELLDLMNRCDFKYVFLGIETPDEQVLTQTQKRINTVKPLIDRVHRIYQAGISVTAGFIIGFDSEPDNADETLIKFIQESGIIFAMVGLLTALPNTQLTRRLSRERRLISSDNKWITQPNAPYQFLSKNSQDQTVGGLNFVTVRDRVDIYRNLQHIVSVVYSPRIFMDRVLDTTRRLQIKPKRNIPHWFAAKRMLRGFLTLAITLLMNRKTRWLYLRNAWKSFWMGPAKFEAAHQLMGSYLHFARQSERMIGRLEESVEFAKQKATYPRSVAAMPPLEPAELVSISK